MSRVIEKVVVVVVVTMREGSLGSGPRFDWENLRLAKLRAASSLRGETSVRERRAPLRGAERDARQE